MQFVEIMIYLHAYFLYVPALFLNRNGNADYRNRFLLKSTIPSLTGQFTSVLISVSKLIFTTLILNKAFYLNF